MTELEKFSKSILELYGFPNYPSFEQTIATMIMHVPQDRCRAPKHKFAIALYKAMANECAYQKIQLLKDAEKAKITTVIQ